MESTWPEPIVDLEGFLGGAGLTCLRREADPESGGKLLQYGNALIAVRLVFDQCVWLVEVADIRSRPSEWYAAAILRDFLSGGQGDDVLSLARKIESVRPNWPAIVIAFGPMRRVDTHLRLAFLRRERAKRRSTPPTETAG
jgi:hypothetical protein